MSKMSKIQCYHLSS